MSVEQGKELAGGLRVNLLEAMDQYFPKTKGTDIGEVVEELSLTLFGISDFCATIGSLPKRVIWEDEGQRMLMANLPLYFRDRQKVYQGENEVVKKALAKLSIGPNIDWYIEEQAGFDVIEAAEEVFLHRLARLEEKGGRDYRVEVEKYCPTHSKTSKLAVSFINKESGETRFRFYVIPFTQDWEEFEADRRFGMCCCAKQWMIGGIAKQDDGHLVIEIEEKDREMLRSKPDKIYHGELQSLSQTLIAALRMVRIALLWPVAEDWQNLDNFFEERTREYFKETFIRLGHEEVSDRDMVEILADWWLVGQINQQGARVLAESLGLPLRVFEQYDEIGRKLELVD